MKSSQAPSWRSFQRTTTQFYPVDTLQSHTDTHPHVRKGSADQEDARSLDGSSRPGLCEAGPCSGAGRVLGGSSRESPAAHGAQRAWDRWGGRGPHSGWLIWEAQQSGRAGLGGMGAQDRGPKLNPSALRSSRAKGVRGREVHPQEQGARRAGTGLQRGPHLFLPPEPAPVRGVWGAGLLLLATSGGRHTLCLSPAAPEPWQEALTPGKQSSQSKGPAPAGQDGAGRGLAH